MAEPEAAATEAAERNERKVREGVVRSNGMDKTAVVEVLRRTRHPQYNKTVQTTTRYYVHDEENTLREGDRVRIVESRPLSKTKNWVATRLVQKAALV